jgi:electron transfer flavoprotein beta subunit
MDLHMIVLVKQVPDTHNISGQAMKEDGTVNRDALQAIFNPEDLNALEEALRLKERYGGQITAITMGPPKAVEVLKECLYRGADEAALISDRAFAGADTLATSYALSCAIAKAGGGDIILCGRQAIDGDTAQVGPQIAQKLGMNQLTNIIRIDSIQDGRMTVRRAMDDGFETVRASLPLLLTVHGQANEPRSPSAKLVMAYKNIGCAGDEAYDESYIEPQCEGYISQIKEWNIEAIQADHERCGLSGSATKVKKIENVVLAARETKQIEDTEQGVTGLVKELVDEHIIG